MPIKPENVDRYPGHWARRSRFVRFHRARNMCEWCRALNYKPHPVTGSKVVLAVAVAHVYDHRPENASLLNLAALCQRCHNRHDRSHRLEGRRDRASVSQWKLFNDGLLEKLAKDDLMARAARKRRRRGNKVAPNNAGRTAGGHRWSGAASSGARPAASDHRWPPGPGQLGRVGEDIGQDSARLPPDQPALARKAAGGARTLPGRVEKALKTPLTQGFFHGLSGPEAKAADPGQSGPCGVGELRPHRPPPRVSAGGHR